MSISGTKSLTASLGPAALAFVLWYWAFAVESGNFWIKISLSAATLATISIAVDYQYFRESLRIDRKELAVGLAAAALLYGMFFLGNLISGMLFPFAGGQVSSIYAKGAGIPGWMIAPALIFITGPSEEIFWRAFLQRRLSERWGKLTGSAVTVLLYTGVHIASMNFMLCGAAGVAGLFWGAMYLLRPKPGALIVSHSVWSAVIFALFPIH